MCKHKVAKALCDTSKKMKFTLPSSRPFCQGQRTQWGAYDEENTATFLMFRFFSLSFCFDTKGPKRQG